MNEIYKYLIPAILGLVIGGLLVNQCSEPEIVKLPGEVVRDTVLRFEVDTVIQTKWKRVHDTAKIPKFPVSDDCEETLHECSQAYDKLGLDYWHLSNTQAEFRKALPWGEVKGWFDMSVYLVDPQKAFEIEATMTRQDSVIVETVLRDRMWWERFGHGPSINVGYSLGSKQIDVTLGYGVHYSF